MTMPPSLWSLKPWWCQPWSIVATGMAGIAGSWWWIHRWWFTLPVSALVLLWWGVFLLLAPLAYRQSVASGNPAEVGIPEAGPGPEEGRPPAP